MDGSIVIPSVGADRGTEESDTTTALTTLNGLLTSSNKLDGAEIGAGTTPDTALASPSNSTYKTLLTGNSFFAIQSAATTYLLGSQYSPVDGSSSVQPASSSGSSFNFASADAWMAPPLFYFDNADITVSGLTEKLRLRCQVAANATAPAANFTFGLYPITVAGAANVLTYTLGTVVPGSAQAINTPSASTVTSAVTSDFTVPSDGAFALGVVTSAQTAVNSAVSCHAQLQTRNV